MAIKQNLSENSFTKLIEDNKLKFYKTARVILKNDDDVYDVLQEALISIYQNYKNLNNKEYFSTWATRIVINKCYDLLKKKKNDTINIDECIDNSTQFVHYDKYETDKYGIQKAMESLSEEQKLITILYYYDGYSVKKYLKLLIFQREQ